MISYDTTSIKTSHQDSILILLQTLIYHEQLYQQYQFQSQIPQSE